MSSEQITTITFFRYGTLAQKLWAFGMMRFAHKYLASVSGQRFYRLMGSGRGLGFNPWPDWSVYCLLQVWNGQDNARQFFRTSDLINKYRVHSVEVCTIFMRTIRSRGYWAGVEPFNGSGIIDPGIEHVAVITRATIKGNKLYKFWKYVPESQKPLENAHGLIYTKGIGEVPIRQMATFSIWENIDCLKKFAHQSREHQKAIQMTRRLGWYSEELFARFQPYAIAGTWEGRVLLPVS